MLVINTTDFSTINNFSTGKIVQSQYIDWLSKLMTWYKLWWSDIPHRKRDVGNFDADIYVFL
jgi:hypothetical protein